MVDSLARFVLPYSALRGSYAAVVVGSGYGGSVAALRLAEAGFDVVVLERGESARPGTFPDGLGKLARSTQVHRRGKRVFGRADALMDFRSFDDVSSLIGCGVGGTSLINAGVAVAPDPAIFDDGRWPQGIRGNFEGLQGYFERAMSGLAATVTPVDGGIPAKFAALQRMGSRSGFDVKTSPVTVFFGSDKSHPDAPDVEPCTMCGNCMSGCNVGAKLSLDKTYLARAAAAGAQVIGGATVDRIEPIHPTVGTRSRWRLTVSPTVGHVGPHLIEASVVVLAAGTFGSAHILLRSRGDQLPLSPALGHGFSGNGDHITFGYDMNAIVAGIGREQAETGPPPSGDGLPIGPTIVGSVVIPADDAAGPALVQDGTIPGAFARLSPFLLAGSAAIDGVPRPVNKRRWLRGWVADLAGGGYSGRTHRTIALLHMGRDSANGVLVAGEDGPDVVWRGAAREAGPERAEGLMSRLIGAFGGHVVRNPIWRSPGRDRVLTVHPLGGCRMADAGSNGVVDQFGRVFKGAESAVHKGLLVVDGSIIPAPLAANPSLTITALAERCVEHLVGELGSLPDSENSDLPAIVPSAGLVFFESMAGTGFMSSDRMPAPLRMMLHVEVPSIEEFQKDDSPVMNVSGEVYLRALSKVPLTVVSGRLQLNAQHPSSNEYGAMTYRLTLRDSVGRFFQLDGDKALRDDLGVDAYADLTTLAVHLHTKEGHSVWSGSVRVSPRDLIKMVTSMSSPTGETIGKRLGATASFLTRFASLQARTYGFVASQTAGVARMTDSMPARPHRSTNLPACEIEFFTPGHGWSAHGVHDSTIRLRRFRGGVRGPVLLAPGLGMSTDSYLLSSTDQNLVERLCAEGFDVWLFDPRMSIALDRSDTPFNLDDIAREDWPTAIDRVRERAEVEDVQVIAHCVGSATALMAALSGTTGIRSMVCSQMTAHFDVPAFTRFRSWLRPAIPLRRLGFVSVEPERTRGFKARAMDLVVRTSPLRRGETCSNPICAWVCFFYGPTHLHQNLNQNTHGDLQRIFGRGSLTAMDQVGLFFVKRRLVDHKGADVYLPNRHRLTMPILILSGAENRLVYPTSGQRTESWLAEEHGWQLHRRVVLDGYAHLDSLIGKDAHTDVFGHIVSFLHDTGGATLGLAVAAGDITENAPSSPDSPPSTRPSGSRR